MPEAVNVTAASLGDFDPVKSLARTEKIEKDISHIQKGLDFVTSTNWFILIVLFIGFIALLVSLISGVVAAYHDSTASQIELTKSIDALQYQLNNRLPASPTPSPATLVVPTIK